MCAPVQSVQYGLDRGDIAPARLLTNYTPIDSPHLRHSIARHFVENGKGEL